MKSRSRGRCQIGRRNLGSDDGGENSSFQLKKKVKDLPNVVGRPSTAEICERLNTPLKRQHDRRKTLLEAVDTSEKLAVVMKKFKTPKEAYFTMNTKLKGSVSVEELMHHLQKTEDGKNIKKSQVERLLREGYKDRLPYDHFTQCCDPFQVRRRLEKEIYQSIRQDEEKEEGDMGEEEPNDSKEMLIGSIRNKIVEAYLQERRPIKQVDREPRVVLERYLRDHFTKRTILEYTDVIHSLEKVNIDLSEEEYDALLMTCDESRKGFINVHQLRQVLVQPNDDQGTSTIRRDPIESIQAFLERTEKEIKEIDDDLLEHTSEFRKRHPITRNDSVFNYNQSKIKLPPTRNREARQRPQTCPDASMLFMNKSNAYENPRMKRSVELKKKLFASANDDSSTGSRRSNNKRTNIAQMVKKQHKRITRNCSTPSYIDTRPRIGLGETCKGTSMYMDDQTRLHSTQECAYQPHVKDGDILEFSAAHFAKERTRSLKSRGNATHTNVTRVFDSLFHNRRNLRIGYLSKLQNKAELEMSYLKAVAAQRKLLE